MICWIKKLSLMLVISLVGIGAAHAHKVTIFAWAEGDTVYTESKFSGGKKVRNGKVEVFDNAGTLLLVGRTGDHGEFSFKAPKKTDLKIVLTAGMGHQNSWRLRAAELGADAPGPSGPGVAPAAAMASAPGQDSRTSAANPGLSAGDVEAIVARQLEQKIQPLTRMLVAAQDRGPTLSDVFGGIGYIVGLVGLGAYLRYRKDNQGP
jgi:nickel transport protein